LPENILQFEKRLKSIMYSGKDIEVLKTFAGNKRVNNIGEVLFPPPYFVDSTEEALNSLLLGYTGAGVQRCLDSTRVTSSGSTGLTIQYIIEMISKEERDTGLLEARKD